MQQMLNSTPSRKTHIHLFDSLRKMVKKFFTIESLMVFIFFVSFATYQIFLKKILFKEIHIPLHATHFNIDYNEEKMLIAETEEDTTSKICIFLFEVFTFSILFSSLLLITTCKQNYFALFFISGILSTFLLVFMCITNLIRSYDMTPNQKEAFIFKKDLKNILSEIQVYPINLNQNSILETNKYNRKVASYNLKIKSIEDFLKEEKNYFKNYVTAQALINLDQENIHIKYIKAAADYFIETPVDKLEFSPRANIVFNIESKAYGKAISHLAKKYQSATK